ncbi:phosphate uptake regulator, PhoU [Ferroglobus placidus DSM 10642]|uniref:Phosphate uptake regulator, PhoU n=1 Tax=Ferroglobus placidus (strain DSM 10642 / AEDII12DO) TaxID=589924 RepID=D3RXB8_FERPA|nr:PhoU domain-containing protein [Ferroglobus placidus]ADC65131.1 phosphate uptake regulator, PhoU [Ferroglobus placidus DSM 10642]
MKVLEERLNKIKEELIEMHRISKEAVELCLDSRSLAKVSSIERRADVMNTDIDDNCLVAVALYQPVARDLRFLASVMRLSANYERITDLAEKIAKLENKDAERLKEMQETVLEMFDIVYEALSEGKIESLKDRLVEKDDVLDKINKKILEENMEKKVKEAIDTIIAAKHFERIGDILSKNGSRIIYIEEGKRVWIK